MNEYRMTITESDDTVDEDFRFYVSGRNVKIQWTTMPTRSGVRDTQNINLDAWFDRNWLDAYGLDPNYKGGTFSIDTAREMWNYLYRYHSVNAKRKAKA